MSAAIPLAGTYHGGEDLLGDDRRVELLHAPETRIASPAVRVPELLTEVAQQIRATTAGQLAVLHHAVELPPGASFLFLILHLADPVLLPRPIPRRVEENAVARQTVAPRPARLLVVALDALGHVVVDDEANVGLVDAHAERDGGNDDRGLIPDEPLLVQASDRRIESGMIRQGAEALCSQILDQLFRVLAREAVDDRRFAPVLVE